MIQDVLGLPVNLAAPFDFSFLGRYGRPFCVFDQQTSGNIAFGMESAEYGRLFVKFAGAPTVGGTRSPQEAVAALKNTAKLYTTLQHPALVRLLGQGEVAGGYALIFRWAEGENLYQAQAKERLRHQPQLVKLRMLDRVFDFHLLCARKSYTAVHFCDSNLIVDFTTGQLTICDIDLYRPSPAVNDLGRMPGSARFMAPEEYEKGAPLDGRTMQYAMGALAFCFLSGDGSFDFAHWTAGRSLFDVAARAVSLDRAERFASIGSFLYAWREAVRTTTLY